MDVFNVIFPMAGESRRFDYQFKPFLQISDKTFIELAYLYFKKYEGRINQLYFIITQEQENNFDIKNKLNELFQKCEVIIIPEKTLGPFQTICKAIEFSQIDKQIPVFICDCDHSIDIEPMIREIDNSPDIIIPYWDITNENHNDWGIIYFSEEKKVINYSEKYIIEGYINYAGIIGCYYFKNLNHFNHPTHCNITDLLQEINREANIVAVKIERTEFFGDKVRLEKTIENRKKLQTIFCDIDGTLIKHEKYPDNVSLDVLPGTIDKLERWKNKGHKIILTTARTNKKQLSVLLKKNNIPFDKLICCLPSGKRYLINDFKSDLLPMSHSFNIPRDKGIGGIDLSFGMLEYKIIKVLKGNSFSKTVLLEENGLFLVRKYILKNTENKRHYEKLKRQYYDLQRMNSYSIGICPKVFNEMNLDYIYSFDLEYLVDYQKISSNEVPQLLDLLNKDIYCSKKNNGDEKWVFDYFQKKITIELYKSINPLLQELLNAEEITINDKVYYGIPKLFKEGSGINISVYNPKYLSVIHGDLTFENIMYHRDTNDIKLIDLDGSDFIDAIELDMGKLLQSYLTNYECWSDPFVSEKLIINIDMDKLIINTNDYTNTVDPQFYKIWGVILNESDINFVRKKGIFYMCTHLLRMIPYLFNSNRNACIYCIKEIIIWLNLII